MFEALQQDQRRSAGERFLALFFSVCIHSIVILLLVVVPLLFFRVLPEGELLTFLIAAPVPPPAPPPPIPPSPGPQHSAGAGRRAVIVPIAFAPAVLPRGIAPPNDEPPDINALTGISGLAVGTPPGLGVSGAGIPSDLLGTGAAPISPPPPPPARRHAPVPIVSNLQESKLIKKVVPEYPAVAKRARVEGVVQLQVIVNEEGDVSDVKVLEGHPLLIDEAVRAVKQWKYSPTLLNGEPVPVVSTVTVIFRLR
jgi:protein TonB